jgi:hypothetical protein
VILEAVAVETVAVEMESTTPVAETAVEATPGLGTTVAPEVRVETRVCPLRGASTDVVVREPVIEEAVLIRLAPMSEATSSSRGGLELLDDNFIDRLLSLGEWSLGAIQSSGSRYVASTLRSLVLWNTQ